MRLGLTLPQGCDREYVGLDPAVVWQRTLDVARLAEDAGFESLWLYDHFQVDPPLIEAPVLEPFVELAAIAMATSRARLGHLVLAAAYRPAGLTAKMISTLDVISGGRVELGIGAGWKQDEWIAYGYGFPDAASRLAILEDHLEVITRMMAPGRATWQGRHAQVIDAIHEPTDAGSPIPVVIGGNGPRVTWRLAARFADELNLDALTPTEVSHALPIIRQRCVEQGRDPATLRVSVHLWGAAVDVLPGTERQERLLAYAELGLARAIVQGFPGVQDPATLDSLISDCAEAGLLGT
jgi:alkanesulfonate monooxygenase SsuD/methylene tetrahydromethanopterin reductase-like flavin-dependent oxidoreductase (luciferase family)